MSEPSMSPTVLPGQERYVDTAHEEIAAIDSVDDSAPPTSMWRDAWQSLRKNPLFIVSAVLIVLILVVALFPDLFTHEDPKYCVLTNAQTGPGPGHWFGFDQQGCDVFARVIHGARASVTVGVVTTLIVMLLGGVIGAFAGFYGGWLDAVLARITDIFFAVPLVLGAIVLLNTFKTSETVWKVILALALFGWTQQARITRGAVLEARNSEFITASTALGASGRYNLLRHALPNALAPIIVNATVSLGTFIVAEATLSYLGIGLPPSIVSWGGDISSAQVLLRVRPQVLFFPAGALAVTVLSFILLGDAVREALDPTSRKR
ncbi:oligopeptide transport system permease protein [Propionibacterium cyclohexanicum]|uniref:Oligopeptide transport system permease protein n=1 Tax=Propionibacterium cyclohexanicum TaxID=64702 RepID=A0A1H9SYS2_9ACTN|nr:ABC transporter permease [Propionibacterium cyclohexanicum]SER90095.1 oligopeptide transport system permease protein [Propionibacterium cyclohexanicum]